MSKTSPPARRAKKSIGASELSVTGFLDRIDTAGVGGWVVDFANPGQPQRIRILIDSVVVDVLTCDLQRDDTALLKLPGNRIGFYYNIPARYHDGLRHVISFATLGAVPINMASRSGTMAGLHFCLQKPLRVEGMVDGMIDGLIQGWALNVDDHAQTRLGGVRILVTCGDEPVAELLADQYRADVALAVACDAACAFNFAPAPELRTGRRTQFRFFAMPAHQELQGSPLELTHPEDEARERLVALTARADELFTFAYHLRRELQAALPRERYLLSDYARWAKQSLPLAAPRAVARALWRIATKQPGRVHHHAGLPPGDRRFSDRGGFGARPELPPLGAADGG